MGKRSRRRKKDKWEIKAKVQIREKKESDREVFFRFQQSLDKGQVVYFDDVCKKEVTIEHSNPYTKYFCKQCGHISPDRVFIKFTDGNTRPLSPKVAARGR